MSDNENHRPPPAKDSLEFAQSIVDTVREPLVILDAQLRVKSANRSFYQAFAVAPRRPRAGSSTSSATASGTSPGSGRSSKRSSPKNHSFRDLEVDHDFEGIGRRRMLLNARKVWQGREPLRTDPARHRGHHRPLAGRGRA